MQSLDLPTIEGDDSAPTVGLHRGQDVVTTKDAFCDNESKLVVLKISHERQVDDLRAQIKHLEERHSDDSETAECVPALETSTAQVIELSESPVESEVSKFRQELAAAQSNNASIALQLQAHEARESELLSSLHQRDTAIHELEKALTRVCTARNCTMSPETKPAAKIQMSRGGSDRPLTDERYHVSPMTSELSRQLVSTQLELANARQKLLTAEQIKVDATCVQQEGGVSDVLDAAKDDDQMRVMNSSAAEVDRTPKGGRRFLKGVLRHELMRTTASQPRVRQSFEKVERGRGGSLRARRTSATVGLGTRGRRRRFSSTAHRRSLPTFLVPTQASTGTSKIEAGEPEDERLRVDCERLVDEVRILREAERKWQLEKFNLELELTKSQDQVLTVVAEETIASNRATEIPPNSSREGVLDFEDCNIGDLQNRNVLLERQLVELSKTNARLLSRLKMRTDFVRHNISTGSSGGTRASQASGGESTEVENGSSDDRNPTNQVNTVDTGMEDARIYDNSTHIDTVISDGTHIGAATNNSGDNSSAKGDTQGNGNIQMSSASTFPAMGATAREIENWLHSHLSLLESTIARSEGIKLIDMIETITGAQAPSAGTVLRLRKRLEEALTEARDTNLRLSETEEALSNALRETANAVAARERAEQGLNGERVGVSNATENVRHAAFAQAKIQTALASSTEQIKATKRRLKIVISERDRLKETHKIEIAAIEKEHSREKRDARKRIKALERSISLLKDRLVKHTSSPSDGGGSSSSRQTTPPPPPPPLPLSEDGVAESTTDEQAVVSEALRSQLIEKTKMLCKLTEENAEFSRKNTELREEVASLKKDISDKMRPALSSAQVKVRALEREITTVRRASRAETNKLREELHRVQKSVEESERLRSETVRLRSKLRTTREQGMRKSVLLSAASCCLYACIGLFFYLFSYNTILQAKSAQGKLVQDARECHEVAKRAKLWEDRARLAERRIQKKDGLSRDLRGRLEENQQAGANLADEIKRAEECLRKAQKENASLASSRAALRTKLAGVEDEVRRLRDASSKVTRRGEGAAKARRDLARTNKELKATRAQLEEFKTKAKSWEVAAEARMREAVQKARLEGAAEGTTEATVSKAVPGTAAGRDAAISTTSTPSAPTAEHCETHGALNDILDALVAALTSLMGDNPGPECKVSSSGECVASAPPAACQNSASTERLASIASLLDISTNDVQDLMHAGRRADGARTSICIQRELRHALDAADEGILRDIFKRIIDRAVAASHPGVSLPYGGCADRGFERCDTRSMDVASLEAGDAHTDRRFVQRDNIGDEKAFSPRALTCTTHPAPHPFDERQQLHAVLHRTGSIDIESTRSVVVSKPKIRDGRGLLSTSRR